MAYINASISNSPTIVGERKEEIKDVAHTFVKFDSDGKLEQAGTGEVAIGIVIGLVEDEDTMYTVQIKDMGLIKAGAEIKVGQAIAVGDNGKAKVATTGEYIMGYCTRGAAEGGLAQIQITKSGKEA